MFKLELPGGIRTGSYYTSNNELKFDPPVYEQRYATTVRLLEHEKWGGHIKKIVEFGCAEMKLLTLMKRIDGVEHILEVDIDEEILNKNSPRAKPLLADYLQKKTHPFRVDIYKGSIDTPHECLRNTDAVIGVEIIEHLFPEVLENVPYNIFGFIQPKIAILSTPNSEFNVLFTLDQPNGFRHWDHKFEWTRKQFKDWCLNICARFPNYQVSILGVGKPPPEHRAIGYVSQMAIFVRNDILGMELVESLKYTKTDHPSDYSLIQSIEFPYTHDERTSSQKILDEAKFHLHMLRKIERFNNHTKSTCEIPINSLFEFVHPLALTITDLTDVLLENNFNVEDNFIIFPLCDEEDEDSHSENSQSDDDFYNTECEGEIQPELNAVVHESDGENWD